MEYNQNTIKNTNNYNQGFSLIELLIILTIIGIIASIAFPSYQAYILRSHRIDALQTLTQDQIILERCYSQNFAYNAACGALPAFPQTSTQGYYSISISNTSASTYTLTATPVGTQAKDTTCSSFSVNQANVKTASDSGGTAQSVCWGSN